MFLPNWIIGQGPVVIEGYPVQYLLLYIEKTVISKKMQLRVNILGDFIYVPLIMIIQIVLEPRP